MVDRALFITFEGGEGAGKSTQIRRLARAMRDAGRTVRVTREPGGTPGAEALREALLAGHAEAQGPLAEACLFASARADHVRHFIRPTLGEGVDVLCDRFIDSTRAYQGVSGVDEEFLSRLDEAALAGLKPHLTVLLDLDPVKGLSRADARRGEEADPDRFEADRIETHAERRQAFLRIAAREPDRVVVIPADGDEASVAAAIRDAMSERLGLDLPSPPLETPVEP